MNDQHHEHTPSDPQGVAAHGQSGYQAVGTTSGAVLQGAPHDGAQGGAPGGAYGEFQRVPLTGGIAWPNGPGAGWSAHGPGKQAYAGQVHAYGGQAYDAGRDSGLVVDGTAVERSEPSHGEATAYHTYDGGHDHDAEMAGHDGWQGQHAGAPGADDGYREQSAANADEHGGADGHWREADHGGYDGGGSAGSGDEHHRDDPWLEEPGERRARGRQEATADQDEELSNEEADGLDAGLDDMVVGPVGRPKKPMAAGAKLGFGVGAVVVVVLMAVSGYIVFTAGSGTNVSSVMEQTDDVDASMAGRRPLPMDPMTAMVAKNVDNSGGRTGGWGAPGAYPAPDRQAPASPSLINTDVGGGSQSGRPVSPPTAVAGVPGSIGTSGAAGAVTVKSGVVPAAIAGAGSLVEPASAMIAGSVPVSAAGVTSSSAASPGPTPNASPLAPSVPAQKTLQIAAGGVASAGQDGIAGGVAGGLASGTLGPVAPGNGGGEELRRLVEGLSVQVAALTAKIDAGKPGADVDALKRDVAAVTSRMEVLEHAGVASSVGTATKAGDVNRDAAKEVAKAAANEAVRMKSARTNAKSIERAKSTPAVASARRHGSGARSVAVAERDASGKGCRLHGATDATFGGTAGLAWISSRGSEAQQVEVGQKAPCIGKVTAIFADAHNWVVRGVGGTLRMPHGG